MHFAVNNPNTVYKFGDANIKAECDIKDIGVFVSNNLENAFHCNKLLDKMKRLCFKIFCCLKSCAPTRLLIT